jgi:hypothetical protein
MRRFSYIAVVFSLTALVLSSGCRRGSHLWVQQKKFKPRLPTYLQSAYRGRAIHLKPFVNRTTSTYYYYSPDGSVTYEGSPSLQGYTRDCFRKALTKFMGMRVTQKPAPGVPNLKVTLQRWTSQRIDAVAVLYRGNQPVLKRQYTVKNPAPATLRTQHLQASAFYQMNLLIARIFMDRAFFTAYYRRAGGAATYQRPADQPPAGKGGQPGPGPAPAPAPGATPAPGTPPAGGPGTAPPPAPGHKDPAGPASPGGPDAPAPDPPPAEGSTPSAY